MIVLTQLEPPVTDRDRDSALGFLRRTATANDCV
jgi:hypothetical protein